MNKIAVIVGVSILGLAGCSVKSSGVRTLGPDTYTISVNDLSDTAAKGIALGLAESHCNEMGKRFLVTKMLKRHQVRYHYEIDFLCLNEDDERLVSPQYDITTQTN